MFLKFLIEIKCTCLYVFFLENPIVTNIDQSSSSPCQDIVQSTSTIEKPLTAAIRFRVLPGDTLSNRKFTFCYSIFNIIVALLLCNYAFKLYYDICNKIFRVDRMKCFYFYFYCF